MTWRKVAAIWVAFAALGILVLLLDHVASGPSEGQPGSPVGPSLLEAEGGSVTTITFRHNESIVRLARRDGTWQTMEPPGVRISPDLVEATIATLTTGQAAERLADHSDQGLDVYGLDQPTATLEIALGPPPALPVIVTLGARNPTQTAVYARRSDRPTVYLVGLNLRYYIDLVFEAASGG